ncbi:MmcQ/YjbR family DNA-binding protein [Agrococcus casei]|uniref:MmcQ/YjbR family DNA-binding protein n=1 Tax=Agrococcus casei TaxID=343512 RepID=UPI003F8DD476
MRRSDLHKIVREAAEALPGSGMSHPFGPEYEVWKVRGKVFALLTDLADGPIVVIKSDPEDSRALRETYADITPGYNMNKKHWITLRPGPSIDNSLAQELVTESYRLVVMGLPRAQRPIDPDNFAATAQ